MKVAKIRKISVALILIIVFILCFIPPKDYNCKYKLNIRSTYGDIEAYHPKVLAFENGWNGYKYWMVYTPYPQGDDSKENPHIATSNNLIEWETPEGLINPLDERVDDGEPKQYNSDAHIVYNSDLDIMECYWRYVDDKSNKCIIYRMKSEDGINWDKKEIAISSNDRQEKDYVSPAIIYEDKLYKMWYVDKNNTVTYAVSQDGINWIDKKNVNIEYEEKLKTWHLDVIKTNKGYEMITVAYDKWANHNDMSLYYTSSSDGVVWDKAKEILKPTVKSNNWDNKGIYRSSFIYQDGIYYVFYSGTSREYNHGIGLVYGKDIYNLKRVNIDFNDKEQVDNLEKKLIK